MEDEVGVRVPEDYPTIKKALECGSDDVIILSSEGHRGDGGNEMVDETLQIRYWKERYRQADEQIKALAEALRFYADANDYTVTERYSGGEFVGVVVGDIIANDGGHRARAALAAVEEVRDESRR